MEVYNVLIVDDEPTAREILEDHLTKIEFVQLVGSCKNAVEAFALMHQNKIDLIFLDINMPEISGLTLAKAIQKGTKVIFTTAYREYAVEGFDLQAVDYLLKPISLERLLKAIQKFKSESTPIESANGPTFTFFRCDRKMVRVDFDQLLFIESFGDYLKLHTNDGVLVTRETMQDTYAKLPHNEFCRVHRSYIVHLKKADSYTNEQVTIGRHSIPISRNYKNDVLAILEGLSS